MTYYIFSTHTNSITYVEYDKESNRSHNVIKRRFLVAGGHGLCNKNLVTPQGMVTRVEKDDDMDWLNSLASFKKDITNGFIRVMKRREDPERVVLRDMCPKDGSAPKTPKDFTMRDNTTHSYTSNSVNFAQ